MDKETLTFMKLYENTRWVVLAEENGLINADEYSLAIDKARVELDLPQLNKNV